MSAAGAAAVVAAAAAAVVEAAAAVVEAAVAVVEAAVLAVADPEVADPEVAVLEVESWVDRKHSEADWLRATRRHRNPRLTSAPRARTLRQDLLPGGCSRHINACPRRRFRFPTGAARCVEQSHRGGIALRGWRRRDRLFTAEGAADHTVADEFRVR